MATIVITPDAIRRGAVRARNYPKGHATYFGKDVFGDWTGQADEATKSF